MHIAPYIKNLRTRLKNPSLALGEVREIVAAVTGIALEKRECTIRQGTLHLSVRPEKRIAILTHEAAILEVLHDKGIQAIRRIV